MTAWLNRVFPSCGAGVIPCDGTGATDMDDTIREVVLTGVEIISSSTADLTGCSTIFWGFFY